MKDDLEKPDGLLDEIQAFSDSLDPKTKNFLKGLLTFIFVAGIFTFMTFYCLAVGKVIAAQEICDNLDMIPVKDPMLDGEMTCVHESRFESPGRMNRNPTPINFNWSDKE